MPRKRSRRSSRTSSAFRNSLAAAGCFLDRFQATFINSNSMSVGAWRRWPSIASITRSASGSANASAAIAEASTTLSAIAHLADDIHGALALGELPPPGALVDLARGDRGNVAHRLFDDGEQLALQRPAVA